MTLRTRAGEPLRRVRRDTWLRIAQKGSTRSRAGQPRNIGERGSPAFQLQTVHFAWLGVACGAALRDWIAGQPCKIG